MYIQATRLGPDINFAPVRNYYPAQSGVTIATVGSAASPDGTAYAINPGKTMSDNAAPVTDNTMGGKPVNWWVGIAIALGLMLWIARKTGEAGEFSNIRASTYNFAFIGFSTVLALTFLKIVAVK